MTALIIYPPDSVTATRNSDTQITVTWTNPSQTVTDQEHSRWSNTSNAWSSWSSAGVGATTTSWVDTACAANTRYRYQIRRYYYNGTQNIYSGSTYSGYVQTTPTSPNTLVATLTTPTSVTLSWNTGATNLNGYVFSGLVEEQVNGGAWTQVASVSASGSASWTKSGLTPGSTYAYRVRNQSTVGATLYSGYATSSTLTVLAIPDAPTGLTTTRNSDTSFTLAWTNNPSSPSKPYSSLNLQRLSPEGGTWATIATLSGTTTSFTDTTTTTNTYYKWRIAAVNDAGTGAYAEFAEYQTKPADPSNVVMKAVSGGLQFTWQTNAPFSTGKYTSNVRYFKDGVLQTDTISVAGGTSSYTLTGVTATSTYQFGVRTVSTTGYTSQSNWVDAPAAQASTPPNAPTNLAPSGTKLDAARAQTLTWVHSPGTDKADQTAFDIRYSTNGGSTWTQPAKVTSAVSSWTMPANTVTNGSTVAWQVRTYGVNATAGAWSASASFGTSATPIVTLTSPSGTTLTTSALVVQWTYSDAENTAQAYWETFLYDGSGNLLETQSAANNATQMTFSTPIADSASYQLKMRVQDGDGLFSDWVIRNLTCHFTPPAAPTMSVDYVPDTGVNLITLTPTAPVAGQTVTATRVDIQRHVLDRATGEFGPWETIAQNVSPDATLVDTTAPIAQDGEYRTITYSAIPSTVTSTALAPNGFESDWMYVSGDDQFSTVCRMVGNITISRASSRDRTYYNFAGRKRPVGYAGATTTRTLSISGLLDDESSSPDEWEAMVANCDVLLLRSPLGDRIYGSIEDLSIDFNTLGLYSISFTITEVDY